jgi:hypothetical protein
VLEWKRTLLWKLSVGIGETCVISCITITTMT